MNLRKDWVLVSLEELATETKGSIRRGPFGGSLKKEIFIKEGYLVYEQQHAIENDFSIGRYFIDENKYKEMEGFNVIPDDLIISCAGTIGKIAIAPQNARPGIINQALMRIRPDQSKILPIYLKRYLESPIAQKEIFSKSSGSALKNLAAISEIKKSKIPLPPIAEQRRIAAILDKADGVRRKRQEAIRLTEELGRSLFLDMFGDPVTNPKGWELIQFSKACERITVGIVVQPASYYVDSGIPAIRSLNIKPGKIVLENLVFFSEEDNNTKLAKTKLKAGDLVLVRSGQPGTAAVIPEELNGINAIDVLIVTPLKKVFDVNFLCSFFNSSGGRELVLSEQRGQIQKHLNVGSLNKSLIPLPPLEMQQRFSRQLIEIQEINKKTKHHLQESENLFNSLLQRAFRGEL
jgi:type I restriction enzyme S subunit